MKKFGLIVGIVAVTTLMASVNKANAQRRLRAAGPIYAGTDADGATLTDFREFVGPVATWRLAIANKFAPHPVYTYSNPGILAGRTHTWNQQEALGRPWHGPYGTWRWQEPTALVVPPTAAYHSTYAWGVGQVRSTPIHHQFGTRGAGTAGGGAGTYARPPLFPASTDQFGVYPVRAPW